MKNNDKRIFPRLECALKLDLLFADGTVMEAEATNVSLSGAGLVLKGPVPLDAHQTLTVELEGELPVAAEIRWQQGEQTGICFRSDLREVLESWVGNHFASRFVRFSQLLPLTEKPKETLRLLAV